MVAKENGKSDAATALGLVERPAFVWEAEAERLKAEARRANAEAAGSEALAAGAQIALEREQEKRAEELAGDKWHHRYVFAGQVDQQSVNTCIKQLQTWVRQSGGDSKLDISLIINSPGGDIVAGFALIDFLMQLRSEGHRLTTEALGMAASMAGVILQAGDTRVMGDHAFLLLHEAQFGAVGSWGDVEDRMRLVEMMQDRILDLFASRSKMTKPAIKKRWSRKDWWISAPEALGYGFVDRIGPPVTEDASAEAAEADG